MYFPDLSSYTYNGTEPVSNVLTVGWLSAEHNFLKGSVSRNFLAGLQRLISDHTVNMYRGSHICEYCPAPKKLVRPGLVDMWEPWPGTEGNGEVRIKTPSGIVFVAPVLVMHYVAAHQYLPPAEFIHAVEQFNAGVLGYDLGGGRTGGA